MDVNAALSHQWIARSLEHVAGLGPRKLVPFLTAIRKVDGGALDKREEILTELHAVEERVYRNAAYAINITDGNVLDGSVFIPKHYDKAIAIASAAASLFKLTNPVLDANALSANVSIRARSGRNLAF